MKWPFGKVHKGKELTDMPTDYLQWVVKESDSPRTLFRGDLLEAVLQELDRRGSLEESFVGSDAKRRLPPVRPEPDTIQDGDIRAPR